MKFHDLPTDVLTIIMSKFDKAADLLSARRTCKALHKADAGDAWSGVYARHPWTIRAPKYAGPHSYKALFVQRVNHERTTFKELREEQRSLQWQNMSDNSLGHRGGMSRVLLATPHEQQRRQQVMQRIDTLEAQQDAFRSNFSKAGIQLEPTMMQTFVRQLKRWFL